MTDKLISLKAAVDEISKYASIWMEYDGGMTQEEVAEAALKAAKMTMVHILEELPSARPEIVRCKDCKNWEKVLPDIGICQNINQGVMAWWLGDDYCSRAERRE